MKILLATGIYPPEIGGPAGYVQKLAQGLHAAGMDVTVLAYGKSGSSDAWSVVHIPRNGGPFVRWWRYARALRRFGADADVVYAFSTVSAGVPLAFSRLRKPRKLLRLGGDFFWERYTDFGGRHSLRQWYENHPVASKITGWILMQFHHLVFSTEFQQTLYTRHFRTLPHSTVIENAQPAIIQRQQKSSQFHTPLRLLFLGRFVRFKNLSVLLRALPELPDVALQLVGDGPEKARLQRLAMRLDLQNRVVFCAPLHGEEKQKMFAFNDILILPSLTEISPNTALEAVAAGMTVLLTEETGLSTTLTAGMYLRPLRTTAQIVAALADVKSSKASMASVASHTWDDITFEHMQLFRTLLLPTQ